MATSSGAGTMEGQLQYLQDEVSKAGRAYADLTAQVTDLHAQLVGLKKQVAGEGAVLATQIDSKFEEQAAKQVQLMIDLKSTKEDT
eukprot:2562060-Lingulodinium_polyedra.AAC.1